VIGRPGSTLWLLGCEMRLTWRNMLGRRGAKLRFGALVVVGLIFLAGGVMLALALHDFAMPLNRYTILGADVGSILIFTLMLSQTLAGATEALYTRGDLDLLFSAPISPRKVLTVRFASLAASAFSAFALLALPFLIPLAIFGHWPWLALLPVLGAYALAASGTGLALAVGLFKLIGPRRTRTVAQLIAAVIGAAFFLVSQVRTVLGGRGAASIWQRVAAAAGDPRLRLPQGADWPLRALLGEPLPLASILVAGFLIFLATSAWLSRRFAADASAAQGADAGAARMSGKAPGSFVAGAFAATFLKELRLLRRDIGLLSQVLLRTLYLIPATFLVLRNAGSHMLFALPAGAAAIAFLAGQVGGSLTWITLSAEDEPELLASAPATLITLRGAKLAAGLAPLVLLLAVPLAVLTWFAPVVGLAAAFGSAASAGAVGMINAWHPNPGKRSEFRRRRSGSLLITMAQLLITGLIGGATALAAFGTLFAIIPAAVAALGLLVMRRSPNQIAEALAASA
jgi:ABC-2 type transport system permease protein